MTVINNLYLRLELKTMWTRLFLAVNQLNAYGLEMSICGGEDDTIHPQNTWFIVCLVSYGLTVCLAIFLY